MARPLPAVPITVILIPFVVAVAVLGYLAGYHHPAASASGAGARGSRVMAVGSVLVEYPTGWHPRAEPEIPGLALAGSVGLGPVSGSTDAGLLVGRLPAGEPAPLPRSLLTRLAGLPSTEVVNLLGFQAYRYGSMRIRGYGPSVVLYALPNPGAAPTGLACFASATASAMLRECEGIVARVSVIGQTQYEISPDAGYGRRLGARISTLDRERFALRREMGVRSSTEATVAAAQALSDRLAATASWLAGVEPPLAAAGAQAALAASIRAARGAYARLARAVAQRERRTGEAALAGVSRAEAGIDGALASFALLGYAPAGAPAGGNG